MTTHADTGASGYAGGETAICRVDQDGKDLTYRGYPIEDLAEHATFEEVAYLLIHEKLPNHKEREAYRRHLGELRALPVRLKSLLEELPAEASPVDVLRTGCSILGMMEPEDREHDQKSVADRLLACLASMLLYWHHFTKNGRRIQTETTDLTIAGHFLELLDQHPASAMQRRAVEVALILHSEHGFNTATFAARITASTGSDFHSAVTSAISALHGPAQGGTQEEVMRLIAGFASPEEAEHGVMQMLARNQRIAGFGHQMHDETDPRARILKKWSQKLAESAGDQRVYPVSGRIEQIMWRETQLHPNLDYHSASVYHFCGIPASLFTPLSVIAQLSGWSAHIMEQRAEGRPMHLAASYIVPETRPYVPIDRRR